MNESFPNFTPQFSHLPIPHYNTTNWGIFMRIFQIAAHAESQGSRTHSEENAICPLPHPWSHRHWWLANVSVTDREEREYVVPLTQTACPIFLTWLPAMAKCDFAGIWICVLLTIGQMLFSVGKNVRKTNKKVFRSFMPNYSFTVNLPSWFSRLVLGGFWESLINDLLTLNYSATCTEDQLPGLLPNHWLLGCFQTCRSALCSETGT